MWHEGSREIGGAGRNDDNMKARNVVLLLRTIKSWSEGLSEGKFRLACLAGERDEIRYRAQVKDHKRFTTTPPRSCREQSTVKQVNMKRATPQLQLRSNFNF